MTNYLDEVELHNPEKTETTIGPDGRKKIRSGYGGKAQPRFFAGVVGLATLAAFVMSIKAPIIPWAILILGAIITWLLFRFGWGTFKPKDRFFYSYVSPLIHQEKPLNLWDGIPVGVDEKMRPVNISPTDASMLMAGETRSGKSGALRNMIASFVMDPYVDVAIFNGKGGPDYMPFTRVAKVVNKQPLILLNYLETMEKEIERRWDRLEELDEDKLTEEICQQEMPLKFIVIDEYRRYLRDKECGSAITESLIEIGAIGAGCGVIVIIANQRVSKDIVAPDLVDNLSLRWAFRVNDSVASNLVLGPGAAGRGFDASTIKRYSWRGVGFLDAHGGVPRLVRAYLFERPQLHIIVEKAQQWRREAGTLASYDPNMAVDPGEGDEVPSYELDGPAPRSTLSDMLEVFWPGETRQHIRTLINRAAERWPDVYDPITDSNNKIQVGKFTKVLRNHGINVNTQMNVDGIRRAGIDKSVLEDTVNKEIAAIEAKLKEAGVLESYAPTLDYSEILGLYDSDSGFDPNNIDISTPEGKKALLLLSNTTNNEIVDNSKLSGADLRKSREKAAFDLLTPAEKAEHKARVAEIKKSDHCDYCKFVYTRTNKYTSPTVDHFTPVSSENASTQQAWNLRSSCWACNVSKSNANGTEWYDRVMAKGGFDKIHGGPKVNCSKCNPAKIKADEIFGDDL